MNPPDRGLAGLATALTALSALLSMGALGLVLSGAGGDDARLYGASYAVTALAPAVVGGLLAARRPREVYGWLMLAFGAAQALSSSSQAWADWRSVAGAPLPAREAVAWLANPAVLTTFALLPLLVLLFPDGRPASPRWWWLAAAIAGCVLATLPSFVVDGPIPFASSEHASPFVLLDGAVAARALTVAETAVGLLLFTTLPATVSVLLRFRRADRVQRAQIKWLLLGAATLAAYFVVDATLPQPITSLDAVLEGLVGMVLPAAVGIAILRHRLYDIDRLIKRTAVYATVTAVLAGCYLVTVTAVSVLTPGARTSPVAVAASTLAAAALFRPARGRVQRAVDRRFDRSRYDAARVVEGYRSHVRGVVDLDAVNDGLVDAARRSVHPTTAVVWLRTPGR